MVVHSESVPYVESFRDPAGSLIRDNTRILRRVHTDFLQEFEEFLSTSTARESMDSGALVHTSPLPSLSNEDDHFFEHERISFPSYPYEWPSEMLHAAGELTLDLASKALAHGFGLKDATPYNVLFRGSRPIFVDLLSFEKRNPLNSTWMAYAQFVRTFLLPLLADGAFRVPVHQSLAGRRDGLEPETVYCSASLLQRLSPKFLGLVTLPTWMAGRNQGDSSLYHPKPAASPEQASFILRGVLASCQRHLNALQPSRSKDSTWSGYLDHKSLYSARQLTQKEVFVAEALERIHPASVLDVGANEGHFSFMAARHGSSVVAIDSDAAVVGSIWKEAAQENLKILPLVVDLARPTPATGWRNQENQSFLERAKGHFDLVLMLAVLHHLMVTERVPLEEVLSLAAELTRDTLLIEYIAPEDPMFQRLVRGRESLYSHLTREHFEAAARKHFHVVRSERIEGLHRWMYLFRKRPSTT